MTRRYWKFMLGANSAHASVCKEQGFLGVDFDVRDDLSNGQPEHHADFKSKWFEYFMGADASASRVSSGLHAAQLWRASRGIAIGDIVLSPTGTSGELYVGEVTGDYFYEPDGPLPHRRRVAWRPEVVHRQQLTDPLRKSLGSGGTICELVNHHDEVALLITGGRVQEGESGQDLDGFGLESILEEFLVTNWSKTLLAEQYDIVTDGGELVGRQFPTDTGPIDILAVSKDKRTLLVVELKRGRASDKVVGQIQRYMGYVAGELATPDQGVRGAIIALDDDLRIRRALQVAPNIDFYRYEVQFSLVLQ